MKHQRKPIYISSFLIFVLLFSHSTSVTAQEVENEREFDYLKGSMKGPGHWGELKEEWSACKHGSMQSPIDLSNHRVKIILKSEKLKRSYKPCNSTIKNRGHDIELLWSNYSAGSIKVNGTDYLLQQAHWHSPSEHTINGRRYDLELHMVHVSPDQNNIAVVGLLYQIGPPDAFLSKLINDIMSMNDTLEERNMGISDPNEIQMGGKKYYRYMGSLTIPPCTEGVIWTINKKVQTVSKDQVHALRNAVHDYAERNARPVQPLNDREIHLCNPDPENTSN